MSIVHDPHVATPTAPLAEALTGADAVVVAANHSEFRDPATLAAIAELAGAELPGRGPVELLGRRAGVRLRRGARLARGGAAEVPPR